MLRKAAFAAATAAMIGAGSLVGTTTAASAGGGYVSGSIQFGGPGWNVQIGKFAPYHHRACQPIVKTVKYWKWGRPHWRQVVVGYDCPRRGPPHFPGPWTPGGGWGWGW